MQRVGYALAGPRRTDHDLAQREGGLGVSDCWLRDGKAPDLANGIVTDIGDNKIKPRVRRVIVEPLHKRLRRFKWVARCDDVRIGVAVDERDLLRSGAGTCGIVALEPYVVGHASSLTRHWSRCESPLHSVKACAKLIGLDLLRCAPDRAQIVERPARGHSALEC